MSEHRPVHVRILVTEEGEEGHPMDVVLTTVHIDEDGEPTAQSLEIVDARVRRQIYQVLAKRSWGSAS